MHALRMTLTLFALTLLAAAACAAETDTNFITNPQFTQAGDDGVPVGWDWRTKKGKVETISEGETDFVRITITEEAQDNFIQQIAKLPDEAVKVRIHVRYRYNDIEGGPRGYMEGKVQGRFAKGNDDTGNWIDIGGLEGSSDGWIEKTREVGVPKDVDGLMIRLGFYGSNKGTLDVDYAKTEVVTKADVAAERAKYRPAAPFGPAVSDARYGRLMRGININNWFCQAWNAKVGGKKGGFNAEFFRSYITEHDIKMIADAGFDHIRLPIDPLFLMGPEGELQTELLGEVDRAIKMIRDHDLAVIVDVHPKSNRFKKMSGKPETRNAFIPWWGAFAKHLAKTTDPEWVFLEILNEPGGQGYWNSNYPPYQDQLLTIIRANAPEHTIIASGGAYMLAWELKNIEPHPDRNVIWAIHFYEPSPFTHQGAVWMKDWYRPLRNVPWPLTEENIDEAIASVVDDDKASDKAKAVLRDQLKSGWGTERGMRERFDEVEAWMAEHDRRVHVGEWGVYEKYAPRDSRLRYIEVLSSELAKRNIGWSKWDYVGGGFPIVENPDVQDPSQRRLDQGVIEALGLEAGAQ